jgi:hypothetical protein
MAIYTFDQFVEETETEPAVTPPVTPTTAPTTAPAAQPSQGYTFDQFLAEEKGGPAVTATPTPKGSFWEREGIVQEILKPAYNVGRDIAQFFPELRETRHSVVELAKQTAEIMKRTDIPESHKRRLMNVADQTDDILQDITQSPTGEQILGDVIGLAALAVTPPQIKALRYGISPYLIRGAITGGTIGGAAGMSEGKDVEGVLKDAAIGAVIGAPLEFGGALGIKAGSKLVRGVGAKLKPAVENLATKTPVKFMVSVGERLKKFGDEGQEIVEKFFDIDTKTVRRSGQFMYDSGEAGLYDLGRDESYRLLDALEGRLDPAKLSPVVRKSYNVADKFRREIGEEAQKLGLEIRAKRGVKEPFTPKENFFPHITITSDQIKPGFGGKRSVVFEESVDNAVRLGKFPNREEALRVADDYVKFIESDGKGGDYWINYLVKNNQTSIDLTQQELRLLRDLEKGYKPPRGLQYPTEMVKRIRDAQDEARGMTLRYFRQSRSPRYGHLEFAREFDFPFWDPDPKRVFPKYSLGAITRLETVGQWGKDGEELSRLLGKIKRVQGKEAGKEVSQLVDVVTGVIERAPVRDRASLLIRTLQVPKLTFSQIINLGQSITNTSMGADIPSVAKGLQLAFRKKGVDRALRSGAALENVINEISLRTGTENEFARRFLRWTGFSATEKFNRTVAANVGAEYAARNTNKLLRDPASKTFKRRLAELGVDPDEVLKRGHISENELLTAAKNFTDRTQFRARPIDLPAFASSPTGKMFFQFKNFAYNQSRFMYNQFSKELKAGNYGRAVRDLIVLGTVFPMTGEVVADIQSLATGTKRPTGALERYLDNIAYGGGLGLSMDLIESANRGRLSEALLGPGLGQIIGTTETAASLIREGKLNKSQKRYLINQFGITRPLGNYVYESDWKEGEKFLDTLGDLLD